MFSKTLFALFVAYLATLVIATTPGCLLGAVNQYDDPADIAAVCKSKDATSKIAKVCGDGVDTALSAFADICNEAGVKVSTQVSLTASATGTGSAYATGNSTALATTLATATGGSVPTGRASATGSGSVPQGTGAAGHVEFSAAALLAGLGIFAAAL